MKSPANETLRASLANVTAVVFVMDDAGVDVVDVDIHNGPPVVTVDREPPNATPTFMVTRGTAADRKTIKQWPLLGCRIQWTHRWSEPGEAA